MMSAPVVEEVAAAVPWRRRAAAGWVVAGVAAIGGSVALAWWAWHEPVFGMPQTWLAAAGVAGGAGLLGRGWRRWFRLPRKPLTWRAAVPTPVGERSGWAVPRPSWFSGRGRLSAMLVALGITVAAGAGMSANGEPMVAVVGGLGAVPAAVSVIRCAARRVRFPAGVALTTDGLVTADGLIGWDAIRSVTAHGRRSHSRVRLTVTGRRRPLTVHGSEFGLPPEELARLVERYRGDPQQRPGLGHPPRESVRAAV